MPVIPEAGVQNDANVHAVRGRWSSYMVSMCDYTFTNSFLDRFPAKFVAQAELRHGPWRSSACTTEWVSTKDQGPRVIRSGQPPQKIRALWAKFGRDNLALNVNPL